MKRLLIVIKIFLLVLILILISLKDNFILVTVKGNSMYPTLRNHSYHLAVKVGYQDIARNDIIIFNSRQLNDILIKRVVGLQGDTVSINNGTIYVNDKITQFSGYLKDLSFSVVIPENELYVLGDNKEESIDSMYFGTVSTDNTTIYKLLL